jgi:hypothetical protein
MRKDLVLKFALALGLFAGVLAANPAPAEAGWHNGVWCGPHIVVRVAPPVYRYYGYRPYGYRPPGYYLPRAYFGARPFYRLHPYVYRPRPYYRPPVLGFGIIVR